MNTKKNKKAIAKKSPYEIKQNTQYFVKNRLPAFVLATLIIFWTIASILGIIGYAKSKSTKATGMITASAESIEEFDNGQYYRIDLFPLYGLQFRYGANDEYYSVPQFYPSLCVGDNFAYLLYGITSLNQLSAMSLDDTISIAYDDIGFGYNNDLEVSTAHISDMITVDFANCQQIIVNYEFYNLASQKLFVTIYTEFYYTENEYDTLEFNIIYELSDFNAWYSPYMNIYRNTIDDTLLEYNSHAYGIPLADGIRYYEWYLANKDVAGGYQSGYNKGYEMGKTQGYNNGYNAGYNQGVADENDYTFDGLLSAIFDVPVRTFTSLFNFDILGVNLTSFFLSMLTLAVVIAITRGLL